MPATETSVEPGAIDVDALISYGNAVREQSPAELTREYIGLMTQGRTNDEAEPLLQLVLLLSNPEASFYDLEKAVLLLEDFILGRNSADTPDVMFSTFLFQLLSERLSSEKAVTSSSESLEDERSRTELLNQELQSSRTELSSQRAENVTLRQQLEALIALEEQISLDDIDQSGTESR